MPEVPINDKEDTEPTDRKIRKPADIVAFLKQVHVEGVWPTPKADDGAVPMNRVVDVFLAESIIHNQSLRFVPATVTGEVACVVVTDTSNENVNFLTD